MTLRPAEECRFDLVSLGEVMLRFDPGEERITRTRNFRVWEGGGEYNVARGLRRCFGLRSAIVTALADNPVGRLREDLMLEGGVDLSHVHWVPYDGIGRAARNGVYFLERGHGVRGALGMMDRGHTPIGQLRAGEVDWDAIFSREGSRWFHTGGIMCALSPESPALVREAMEAARRSGAIVSYDCNYRPSLWKDHGGRAASIAVNRSLMPFVDVLFGHEGDIAATVGEASQGPPWHNEESFRAMSERFIDELKAGKAHPAQPSMMKYYGTELNKQRHELLMAAGGSDALEWESERSHGGATPRAWLRTKANSIEGGTSEVQLNIIAKRLLELPGA